MREITLKLSEEELYLLQKFARDAIKDAARQITRGYSVPIYEHRLSVLEKLYSKISLQKDGGK